MLVEYQGKKYVVDFSFTTDTKLAVTREPNGVEVFRRTIKRLTNCAVSLVDNMETGEDGKIVRIDRTEVGVGSTVCSPKDIFDKQIGRRIAFYRALRNAGFSKPDTAGFFAATVEQHNIKL